MSPVIRSIVLLQFVIFLPPLLSDCCLSGFKMRILKGALFVTMVAFVLSGFCALEILGIGLVLLNFCFLYRKQNCDLNARRFCLPLLILALAVLGGRIVWRGAFEFDGWNGRWRLDCSQSRQCSNYGNHADECSNDDKALEKRARSAYELVAGKGVESARMRKVNETATDVIFDFALSDSIHYEVSVEKNSRKVFVKGVTADSLTNNAYSCSYP